LCRELHVPWPPTCQHSSCLLWRCEMKWLGHPDDEHCTLEYFSRKNSLGSWRGSPKAGTIRRLPIKKFILIICFCFFVKTAVKGGSCAAFLSYSLMRCQSSKSCWSLGLTCCTGTSSWDAVVLPIKCTSNAALNSEGIATQATIVVGETVTCCADVWAAANSVSVSTRAVAARASILGIFKGVAWAGETLSSCTIAFDHLLSNRKTWFFFFLFDR